MAGYRGWYLNMPVVRERMVVPNRFQGVALIGTTRIPDATDVCRPSGRGYIMAINPFTGARLEQTFFDANRDGEFDDDDKGDDEGDQDGDGDGDGDPEILSGIGEDSSPNAPIFIEDKMCYTKDDGTTECVDTQGSSAQARRASWREITNN
jgi:type IV pilus assembly protein PilY1